MKFLTIFILTLCVTGLSAGVVVVNTNAESIRIEHALYTIEIEKDGFRYSVLHADGSTHIPAHPASGLRFGPAAESELHAVVDTRLIEQQGERLTFDVENSSGDEAKVHIMLSPNYFHIEIIPNDQDTLYLIDARTGPLNPAYGLGDLGAQHDSNPRGVRDNANVVGIVRDDVTNDHVNHRFISTFTVFPAHNFAQVLFEEGQKRVAITDSENRLGAANVARIHGLYYFIGDLPTIYRDYKKVREAAGYSDARPNFAMFGLGWEAYGALSWNTNQASVLNMLQTYLDKGYRFHWGVVGSGFWKGARNDRRQGATTSFGIWDDTKQPGRDDGHPNPRYPDVPALKKFFADNDIRLLIGLRNNFKAFPEDGGYYFPENDGPYTAEGLENSFFLSDSHGEPLRVLGSFPAGQLYLLDGHNPEALQWYAEGADLWEVDGFKEDAMISRVKTYRDGNWNPLNKFLAARGNLIIVRNTAYSVPGDIMRIDDTRFGRGEDFFRDADRMPINMLNYAASGAANPYPDITGAAVYGIEPTDPSYQKYFVRNAIFNAVSPAFSMGRAPWTIQHPEYEAIVLKAATWHNRYAPYIYSAAIDSYESGFPHTMTPVPLAFPEDPQTYELANRETRQYQWMLGPSMLATPAWGNDFDRIKSRDVYLPAGEWIDYETGEVYEGPKTLRAFPVPEKKIPIFIGGKGIVVFEDQNNPGSLYAQVYPNAPEGTTYRYTDIDGNTRSTIARGDIPWNPPVLTVRNTTNGASIDFEYIEKTNSIIFPLHPGHDYQIRSKSGDE